MLYIVATPIGNLDDLSLRQVRTLMNAEIILAEDTRSTGILIGEIRKRFQLTPIPNQKLISYYKEKEFEKLPEILDLLKTGKNMAIISQSGMPLISDPGHLLVTQAIKMDIPFTVIPGPSSVTTAIVYSGFKNQQFMYVGFFPKKKNHGVRLIGQLQQVKKIFPDISFVFFESPKRINETLKTIDTVDSGFHVCICREMTKKFEEIIRGTQKDLLEKKFKGELTVVIS